MPFVRFARDRRGYEHVYLVEDSKGRGRARLLYWFRTPPGVKVGRPPFDTDTQRSLERQHPDLRFDWPQIVAAKMPPPPPVEAWREKRRIERAIKRARSEELPPEVGPAPPLDEAVQELAELALEAAGTAAGIDEHEGEPADEADPLGDEGLEGEAGSDVEAGPDVVAEPDPAATPAAAAAVPQPPGRTKRRRRRRRGRRPAAPNAGPAGPQPAPDGPLDPTDSDGPPSNEG